MLFLAVLLLSSWAVVSRAGPPPKHFPRFIKYVQPHGWPRVAYEIAHDAQAVADAGGTNPLYQWLFGPSLKTLESKIRYLHQSQGMLDILRRRQDQMGTTPESLDLTTRYRLQAELDAFLHTCILTALNLYDEEVEIDIQKSVEQCEEEFTVGFGDGMDEVQVKGVLNDEDGLIQGILNRNYKKCRGKGYTSQHCKYQTKVTVGDGTIKAKAGFLFQVPSASEFVRGIRSGAVRFFPNPGQPEKRPIPFRGSFKPQPGIFRPP